MNRNTKVTSIVLLIIVILAAVGVLALKHVTTTTQQAQTAAIAAGPAIVGALVETNDARTSITVTSQAGDKKIFAVTKDTQILSLISAGQTGKSLAQANLGDLMAVTADPNNLSVALRIELLPPVSATSSPLKNPATITGSLVSITKNSITVSQKQPGGLPAVSITASLTADTQVLTEVVANEPAKDMSALAPGTMVTIITTSQTPPLTAAEVEILRQ